MPAGSSGLGSCSFWRAIPMKAHISEEMVEFCRDKLSRYKIPRRIKIVDELPKSAMGKVLKRVLRDGEADAP